MQTNYNMSLSRVPAGQFVTLTLVFLCHPTPHFFYMHKRTDARTHTSTHPRDIIEVKSRDRITLHHRNTLWLPFCELLTHVEAVPSAQRDSEKRGKGITQSCSPTAIDERQMSKWVSTWVTIMLLNPVSLSIMVFSCMAHVLTKTDRLWPRTPSPVTPGVQPDHSDCTVICFHPLLWMSCLLPMFINAWRPKAQWHTVAAVIFVRQLRQFTSLWGAKG